MKKFRGLYYLVFIVIILVVLVVLKTKKVDDKIDNSLERATYNLKDAEASKVIELEDGDTYNLEAEIVSKNIDGKEIRMYGYNGMIPGPLLKVKQGSKIKVNFENNIDYPTTVHWHGIRLDNEFDGVPDITQDPVKPGESFTYELKFPDEGLYWYHPHMREDLQQELGLYGNIFVIPEDEDYFNKVDKEEFLFLDDISINGNDVTKFLEDEVTHTLMGRFGNVMLVNGQTSYNLNVKKGEAVRFYLTNSANARVFNFMIQNYQMKLVAGDSGKYEKETLVDNIIISPSERYIVEVLFDKEGTFNVIHKTPDNLYILGNVEVSEEVNDIRNYLRLQDNIEIRDSIIPFRKYFSKEPDFEIELDIDMPGMMDHSMHAMMHLGEDGIEWEDTMPGMNSVMTRESLTWLIRDKKTGKSNMDIMYKVKKGDVKKIRIINSKDSMHPMQHAIHLHGQRFLVLDDKNENLAWKDTVLVPSGKTTDILVDFSNPGEWMIHCHVAEHLEAGMMAMFEVKQ